MTECVVPLSAAHESCNNLYSENKNKGDRRGGNSFPRSCCVFVYVKYVCVFCCVIDFWWLVLCISCLVRVVTWYTCGGYFV